MRNKGNGSKGGVEERGHTSQSNNDSHVSYENRLQVPYIEKKLGDNMISEKKYEDALKHFSKAIMSVKIITDENALDAKGIENLIKEVALPSNLNISLCHMKLKDWKSVITHTSRVLEFDSKNVKGYYRRC